jgi:hypothetical protein
VPKYLRYITDNEGLDPRTAWCREHFDDKDWRRRGWSPVTYHFRNEGDALMFALAWAGRTEP